ncbi:MAG TPA: ComF family protein [Longimicrobiaceae bacterium]|nr:ComF family protein [Longimicrobiaceae bacterium]
MLNGPPREMVHALKYGGWRALAKPLATRMAGLAFPLDVDEEVRYVVPVPLSPVRHRQRGYNQSALLAAEVARIRDLTALPNILLRTRSSESQTTLHPAERRANVAGAFSLNTADQPSINGEHLLVIDDVWTTGATTSACAETLIAAGARAVSVLTFARSLPELDR